MTLPGRAAADPGDDPCTLAVSFLCRFVPMAPSLDGDVDLTKQQPPADPADPRTAAPPLTDICTSGCI
ncbi:MAG: fibronectin-binding protein [Mycobacterium sp.]